MKRAFTLFLCILCIAVILFAPAWIKTGIHKNIYSIRAEKKAQKYTGTLQLWHIVSFKTGGQSGISYLNDQMRRFEKNNPYVYIEITGLTPDEAYEKLANGEQPDIISYPLGFFENDSFLAPLEAKDTILKPFTQCGVYHNQTLAYPYMADFYVLNTNQDMLFSSDVATPSDTQLNAEAMQVLLNAFVAPESGFCVTDTQGLSPLQLFHSLRPSGTIEALPTIPADTQAFLNAEAPLYISTGAEAVKLRFDKRATSLNIRTFSISDYVDAVQLVSIAKSNSTPKQTMCAAFAASLLSGTAQAKLEAVKLLPTTLVEDIFADDPFYSSEYARLSQNAVVPNSFAFSPFEAASLTFSEHSTPTSSVE